MDRAVISLEGRENHSILLSQHAKRDKRFLHKQKETRSSCQKKRERGVEKNALYRGKKKGPPHSPSCPSCSSKASEECEEPSKGEKGPKWIAEKGGRPSLKQSARKREKGRLSEGGVDKNVQKARRKITRPRARKPPRRASRSSLPPQKARGRGSGRSRSEGKGPVGDRT